MPDARPTPLRLFCRPFEDLLTSAPRKTKQKASISRASLLPVWLWLGRDLMPAQTEAYIAETKALIVARKYAEATRRAEHFWTEAGAALAAGAGRRPRRAPRLGDALILADAQEMALLLPAGADMLRIQDVLPRPVPQLNEELLWQLRAIYDELVARTARCRALCRGGGDEPAGASLGGAAPADADLPPAQRHADFQDRYGPGGRDHFRAAWKVCATPILATRHPLFEAETLLDQVRAFTELSSAMVKEIEVKRDGEWGQRLLKDRAQTGNVMDGFMDRAMREVAAALPMQKGTGGTADFSRAVDAEKRDLALRYVRLVVGSRNFAAAGSFAAKQKTAFEEIGAYLRRYIEDVVKELRGADPARRAVAEAQFQFCVELTGLLFSDKEAELLQRRGRRRAVAAA